jgi:CRISPR/Cas system CMR subunit Cmr6 (Cas7 group RAMP superfamily)
MSLSRNAFENKESSKIENQEIEKENFFLKSQIDMLKNENKRLLEMHCREKELWKNNLQEVQQRLVKERRLYRKDISELNGQLESLKGSLTRLLKIREGQNSHEDEFENGIRL